MQYATSVVLAGSPESALKVVRDALMANGFTIVEAMKTQFTATGPGLNSTNQNAIRGVSKATFRTDQGAIHVQAELGGAAWLGRFAMFFPFALALVLIVIFSITSPLNGQAANKTAYITPLITAAPWLVIGPLMARYIRKRTEKAIQGLLQSAAAISQAG